MINKLMNDPKAARIYASLDAHIPPATIADDHLQAKLAGNASLALALECFMRDLARRYFHIPEVLAALAKVERHATMRKPGANAPRMLQDIAGEIEKLYSEGLFDTLADGRIQFRVFTGGTPGQSTGRPHIKITCENMPGAVALVCAKYRRGMGKTRAARYGRALA
jgi:hypothetical protein